MTASQGLGLKFGSVARARPLRVLAGASSQVLPFSLPFSATPQALSPLLDPKPSPRRPSPIPLCTQSFDSRTFLCAGRALSAWRAGQGVPPPPPAQELVLTVHGSLRLSPTSGPLRWSRPTGTRAAAQAKARLGRSVARGCSDDTRLRGAGI